MSLLKNFTHDFKGIGGCDARCQIRIFAGAGAAEGMTVVIATQLVEDEGTSVTNWAEQLATEIAARHGISPNRLVWIEHYPEERNRHGVESAESYDRVTFDFAGGAFVKPRWQTLGRAEAEALIGEPLSPVTVDVTDPRTVVV